jgi:hypothetical protein
MCSEGEYIDCCMFVLNFVLNLYVTVYKRFELYLDVSAN